MATLTVPVMNTGCPELSNVMATLTLPGITETQSVLVGTLASGETKSAKLTFISGTDEKETQIFPWLVIAFGAGCGVLLMICIIQGAVLREKSGSWKKISCKHCNNTSPKLKENQLPNTAGSLIHS